jgi:hypothetical protein
MPSMSTVDQARREEIRESFFQSLDNHCLQKFAESKQKKPSEILFDRDLYIEYITSLHSFFSKISSMMSGHYDPKGGTKP